MSAHTADALASALPAGISYHPGQQHWHAPEIAKFQADRLAESGYVLVHTAPDEATIERLARVVHDADCQCGHRIHDRTGYALHHKQIALAVLAALAGTSAQARHTADDEIRERVAPARSGDDS